MTSCTTTNDAAIRSALHRKHLRSAAAHPNTLIIDELGLAHAKSRIDVAVINGCIHGYEIKSARDNLNRLESQISIYRQTLQLLTIVADSKHIYDVLDFVPDWCGVLEVRLGPRAGIHFHVVRPAQPNPDVDPVMMAHLLWHSEVSEYLSLKGYPPKLLRGSRLQLYNLLCEILSPKEITALIRQFMSNRPVWRDHLRPL